MDEKNYLLAQIGKCKRKLNLALLLDRSVVFATIGFLAAAGLEIISLFLPFYYVHVAVMALAAVFLAAGIILALCHRRKERDAALKLDSFGLKERVITAYEHLKEENPCVLLQRQDAIRCLKGAGESIRIPLRPEGRKILAFFLSLALAAGLAFVPSPARETAQQRHVLAKEAKEKKEELEKFVKKLEQIDTKTLSAEQKARLDQLKESMKLSMEELKKSTSQTALKAASQKLDYKYEQAAGQLGDLASQMKNPKDAGVTAAADMAKAASKNSGAASGASASAGSEAGKGDSANRDSGNGATQGTGDSKGEGESTQAGDQNGDSGQQQAGNGNSGSGSGEGAGSQGNGGNGSGNGDGGNDGGDGSGSGSGKGSGRGTGSGSGTHDYVSVPNQKGTDGSLHGNKNGSENSDYYRAQNGLAWEGEHVSLDSVVGDYTKDAYEGLSSGKYPKGMESVIKSYFKNLNE